MPPRVPLARPVTRTERRPLPPAQLLPEERCPEGRAHQPIAEIHWLRPDQLSANDYNPNHVFPAEMLLLKLSLLEAGWTAPLVVRYRILTPDAPTYEIIDGFHRWTLASTDDEVARLADGFVPVVFVRPTFTAAQQQMATIRMNRARGEHAIVNMAAIVRDLIDHQGVTRERVAHLLGMEDEEVLRLYDASGAARTIGRGDFNGAWVPG